MKPEPKRYEINEPIDFTRKVQLWDGDIKCEQLWPEDHKREAACYEIAMECQRKYYVPDYTHFSYLP